uniref:Uncharacterized protein n=1 Tax=Triticum urartu TaxID=4572 RepID=A0A8R7TKE5_TRIUA
MTSKQTSTYLTSRRPSSVSSLMYICCIRPQARIILQTNRGILFVSDELELVLPEVSEEPDRLVLSVELQLELHPERAIGRDALALPDTDILFDHTFHAAEVQVRRLGDVVDADRSRDAHALAELGRRRGLLVRHVGGRGRGHAADGDLARGAEARAAPRWREAARGRGIWREGSAEEERGGGGRGRRGGGGGGCHRGGWCARGRAGNCVEQAVCT